VFEDAIANLFSSVAGITKLFSPFVCVSVLGNVARLRHASLGDLIRFKVHSFLETFNSKTPQVCLVVGFKFQCLFAFQTLKDRKKMKCH
jgi:hypothetical protein